LNSLQELSNELESKLVEIRLSIRHPHNKDKVFILLEGSTDIKLFRNIFSYEYTDTTNLNGKEKIIKALEILSSEGCINIIGIKDADFDHLEKISYPSNIFMTDYADMEIQMVESNALDSVINEYASKDCYSILKSSLKDRIYSFAIEIGYIRWYSERIRLDEGRGLVNFKRIDFNSIITYNNCQVFLDKNQLINLLYAQLENQEANIEENIALLKEISTDRLQICSGHDLTTLIANYFPTDNINQTKIEKALRLSYMMEYFQRTKLFENLNNWSNTNNYRLFD